MLYIEGMHNTEIRKSVTYLRVRVDGKTIYLKNPTRTASALRGIEVNREGDEIAGKGFDERMHIIDLIAITAETPMVMDKKYGELVEVT